MMGQFSTQEECQAFLRSVLARVFLEWSLRAKDPDSFGEEVVEFSSDEEYAVSCADYFLHLFHAVFCEEVSE